jgi:two-component system CheB/CheR fusion protein
MSLHKNDANHKRKILKTQSINKDDGVFPVVAIGASAGGLEAFEHLFTHLPNNSSMAFVIITHLDRTHESILPELIKKYTSMPVLLISNGLRIQANTVYVIPPNKNVAILNNVLLLVKQETPHYANLPINFFFQSLAEERKEKAIAMVFSGAGSDGTLGIRAIKKEGGVVIAQSPASAAYDSMPQSAINTGLVDYVLSPEQIPEQLIKWLHYGGLKEGKISPELQQIFIMLRSHTSHDFSSYKLNTICRRIEKQMAVHHIDTLTEYVSFLRMHPREVDNLFKDLLIGVTSFFRDSEAFEALKENAIKSLLKNKSHGYCVRVWIPGCSTGEEAYSVAIAIRECMEELQQFHSVQIFGTDIDVSALETARAGIYHTIIENDVTPERLKKYFIKEKNNFRIKKEIREMIVFGAQNIIKDPPFTKLDLICCRNLLIYLSANLQKKILPIFHYSLKSKGNLFLGTSEAIAGFSDLFRLNAKKWKIFERKDASTSTRALLNFPAESRPSEAFTLQAERIFLSDEKTETVSSIKDFILENYISTCMVINSKGKVFYFHGKIESYINSDSKDMDVNIFEVLSIDMKNELVATVRKAASKQKEVSYLNLEIKNSVNPVTINLKVIPILDRDVLHGMFLVIFEDVIPDHKKMDLSKYSSVASLTKKIRGLEKELQYTRENLQTTIEELESSNEELQSTNEELQSTNEEIETSKEELQSLNEELVIVNTELQNRIDQLASVNDDMNNLFNSTQIAAIFLNTDMRIKRFTPKAQDLIHLIQSDIGRSIGHFATNIKYEYLIDNSEEVLRTLIPKLIEVQGKDNKHYLIRILPYRTIANVIDGVVITFTDITAHKDSESKLQKLNESLNDLNDFNASILDTLRESILVLNTDLEILMANRSFYKFFHVTPQETIGKFIYDLGNKQWNIPKLRDLLSLSIAKDEFFEGFEVDYNFPQIGEKKLVLNARKIFRKGVEMEMLLLAIEEG